MRILILTQWFDPEPTPKGLAFVKTLQQAGHEVRVVTGYPNYPGGRVYPGYRIRGISHERMDGIDITRLPLYPSHDQSRLGRVLNYVSFGAAALFYGLFMRRRPDVMYVYHPPLTTALAGMFISWVRGIPFVLDLQDLWPDTLPATGMVHNPIILKVVERLMRWVYARADAILPQSPGFTARLRAFGVPEEKMYLVYNWCDEKALSSRPPASWQPPAAFQGKFVVGYAGNLGMAQRLDALLDAAALLQGRPDICLFIVGAGTEKERLQQRAQALGLSNTIFLPAMPFNEIGGLLELADALVVHLRRDPLFEITVPSKTQAYMFMGKPVVVAVQGDAATLVADAGAGVEAQAEGPRSIADAILQLAAMSAEERAAMGARGRQYYDAHLSLAVGAGRMLAAMEAVVAKARR